MLTLTSRWNPEPTPPAYELTLTNGGRQSLAGFALGFSGAALGIGPHTEIEGGIIQSHLANHIVIAPPTRFVLAPGASWQIVLSGMPHPLRHWTDGAAGAYLVLADGRLVEVTTGPVEIRGAQTEARRGAIRYPLPKTLPGNLSIIPWPNRVAASGTRAVPTGLDPRPVGTDAKSAATAFSELVSELFPAERLVVAPGGMPVAFAEKPAFDPESYELSFDASGATVAASTHTGYLYGLITLGQMLRGATQHPDKFAIPATGTIADAPGLAWRGAHLDVARQVYATSEISRFLAVMAWNKLNRFHWHLTDDESWRIAIDAYPQLTDVGAWRGHGLPIPPLLGSGPAATGGFYSKAEIHEIVAHAGSLGITVVPEIDIPGHCFALLQSVPELRDPAETGAYHSVQGFPNNCLNPGREAVHRVLETIIDEVLPLFPSGIFHLGADEVPLAAWSGSPEALALLEKIAGADAAGRHRARANTTSEHTEADAIEGSGTAALQADFIGRVHRYLTSKGAITGGWEEAAHGDVLDKARSYLVGWRDLAVSAALAGEGYDIVVSPGQRYYLDMALTTEWSEPGAGWAGASSAEQTYRFEPRAGWCEDQLKHLLGVQACIWSERLADRAVFDRLVFPRLSAIAESGWTQPEHKSWERFAALSRLMPTLYGHWSDN